MHSKFRFGIAVMTAVLLPAVMAFGHGGGGGGGGHGGGGGGHGGGFGGGGHGGGFGGGGFHGGGGGYSGGSGHSFSGGGMSGGAMRSGGNFSSGGLNHSAGNLGGISGNRGNATFMKNNFPSSASTRSGTMQHSVNRFNTGGLNGSAMGRSGVTNQNSFVHSNNITNAGANHWTHNGSGFNHNGNNFNRNGNFNRGNNFFFFPGFGFGFGGFGLWGFGYPYWGYGYGYGGYGYGYPAYGYNYYGYGNGYGSGYGYGNGNAYLAAAPPDTNPELDAPAAGNFIDQGEVDFKAGKYQTAARDWQHALVEDPKNGAVMMLLAQSLFAMGQYDEAAGATQAGMQMLPEDKWGVVVSNYSQLYGNIQDYTDQLKTLEKARDAKPDAPALHFLLGFHFGYLGYPKHAVKELDKALTLAPKDLGSRKIRDIFAAKWPEAPPLPAAAVEAAKEAAGQKGGDGKPADGAQIPPALNAPAAPPAATGTPS
jgi:hypothetical protein